MLRGCVESDFGSQSHRVPMSINFAGEEADCKLADANNNNEQPDADRLLERVLSPTAGCRANVIC